MAPPSRVDPPPSRSETPPSTSTDWPPSTAPLSAPPASRLGRSPRAMASTRARRAIPSQLSSVPNLEKSVASTTAPLSDGRTVKKRTAPSGRTIAPSGAVAGPLMSTHDTLCVAVLDGATCTPPWVRSSSAVPPRACAATMTRPESAGGCVFESVSMRNARWTSSSVDSQAAAKAAMASSAARIRVTRVLERRTHVRSEQTGTASLYDSRAPVLSSSRQKPAKRLAARCASSDETRSRGTRSKDFAFRVGLRAVDPATLRSPCLRADLDPPARRSPTRLRASSSRCRAEHRRRRRPRPRSRPGATRHRRW